MRRPRAALNVAEHVGDDDVVDHRRVRSGEVDDGHVPGGEQLVVVKGRVTRLIEDLHPVQAPQPGQGGAPADGMSRLRSADTLEDCGHGLATLELCVVEVEIVRTGMVGDGEEDASDVDDLGEGEGGVALLELVELPIPGALRPGSLGRSLGRVGSAWQRRRS